MCTIVYTTQGDRNYTKRMGMWARNSKFSPLLYKCYERFIYTTEFTTRL